ncbi:MAG: methylenetetrahydrofolate reductase [Spirochaetota bacterium]|nr:MAG: methylenetetrahydrofolate reductase [Spirochaetota bacterium]
MGFRDRLGSGQFIITMDTIPPKGVDLSGNYKRVDPLKGRVDGINVVDMPSAVMRMSALPVSYLLKERGFEPILQVTCRDRNRLSLQADLLGASALGIENFLFLKGDEIELSHDAEAKPVFDLDTVTLLRAARRMEKGQDLVGRELKGAPRFCVGAAVDPGARPLEGEIEKMEQKTASGAEFFQTQPIFDVGNFADFMGRVKHLDIPVLGGILLLKSAVMARFINKNVPGVDIPQGIIAEMEAAADPVEKSIEIAVRTITVLKGIARGVHIMTINWEDKIPLILDALGL